MRINFTPAAVQPALLTLLSIWTGLFATLCRLIEIASFLKLFHLNVIANNFPFN